MRRRAFEWRDWAGLCALLTALPLLASGCASGPFASAPRDSDTAAWQRWSEDRGGVLRRSQSRIETARLARLLSGIAPMCACSDVTIRILDDDRVRAFAWRDGSLFVTRGLLATMTDAELTAAIAHEIGHLASHEEDLPSQRAEELADQWGSELLERSGLPASSMLRMLVKLHQHTGPEFDRPLRSRIQRLEERGPPQLGYNETAQVIR